MSCGGIMAINQTSTRDIYKSKNISIVTEPIQGKKM
jgi:hypothetical protein